MPTIRGALPARNRRGCLPSRGMVTRLDGACERFSRRRAWSVKGLAPPAGAVSRMAIAPFGQIKGCADGVCEGGCLQPSPHHRRSTTIVELSWTGNFLSSVVGSSSFIKFPVDL